MEMPQKSSNLQNREKVKPSSAKQNIREQKAVPLVNHASARGTPAIFVIFVVPRGLSSKALVLLVRTQIRRFRRFPSKTPLFWRGKGTALPKAPFLGPRKCSLALS